MDHEKAKRKGSENPGQQQLDRLRAKFGNDLAETLAAMSFLFDRTDTPPYWHQNTGDGELGNEYPLPLVHPDPAIPGVRYRMWKEDNGIK